MIAEVQADFTIMQYSREMKEYFPNMTIVALSCDYDFLALAPPGSVDALLDPTRGFIIWKEDVLKLLGCDEEALFFAYTIGGCDDITTNLRGVGFHRALLFVTKHAMLDSILEEFDEFGKDELTALVGEIQALQSLPTEDRRSMLEKFACDKDDFGDLRRPGFHSKFLEVFT